MKPNYQVFHTGVIVLLLLLNVQHSFAQTDSINVSQLTKEEVLQISLEDLLEMPMEDLLIISETAGVTINELFAMQQKVAGVRSDSLRSEMLSPVPFDIITADHIANSGHIELGQILQFSIPTFYSTHQTIADGSDSFDPATLRGLGPDQMLVLINGKRRHSSSYLHVNGTVGRGTVGTDLNAIPTSAIERIEIMRDGAAAQYGSDAIAGVINIVLKENTAFTDLNVQGGITQEGDGEKIKLSANSGFTIGNKGFVNFTSEFTKRGLVNRSGDYTGTVYGDERDNNLTPFFAQTQFSDHRVMSIGSAANDNLMLFANMEVPVNPSLSFYAFAGFSYLQTESPGFYRFPKDDHRVVTQIYPHGFTPTLNTNVTDKAFTMGLQKMVGKWNIDFSNSTGGNNFYLTVKNGNNPSMGLRTPLSAYAGGFAYLHNITGLDIKRKFHAANMAINVAFGTEYRLERYRIFEGEEASWLDGGDTTLTNSGEPREVGFQYYPGFRPENALLRYRTNTAVYLDIETDVTQRLLVGVAARYELYNDFGDNLSWKTSARYRFHRLFVLRGAISTGFRAPSLHQIYYNRISTQYLDGEPVQVVNFNNESGITKAFGIERLEPEISTNYSVGITSEITGQLNLAVDAYYILIDNRIVMTGRFKATDNPFYDAILSPLNVSQAQFFTNAIDTKTQGIDIKLNYNTYIGQGNFMLNAGLNVSKTQLDGAIEASGLLAGDEDILFNREEISRIEAVQPAHKLIVSTIYQIKNWTFTLRNTHFGKVEYVHPEDGDPANWLLNELTGKVESRDQTFEPKLLTDIDISYAISEKIDVSLGANNVFHVLPDQHLHSANINEGRFLYSRRVQQFGVAGAFYYVKLQLKLY